MCAKGGGGKGMQVVVWVGGREGAWDEMGWDGMGWDVMTDVIGWDGMGWDGIGWDGMVYIGCDGVALRAVAWDGSESIHPTDTGSTQRTGGDELPEAERNQRSREHQSYPCAPTEIDEAHLLCLC